MWAQVSAFELYSVRLLLLPSVDYTTIFVVVPPIFWVDGVLLGMVPRVKFLVSPNLSSQMFFVSTIMSGQSKILLGQVMSRHSSAISESKLLKRNTESKLWAPAKAAHNKQESSIGLKWYDFPARRARFKQPRVTCTKTLFARPLFPKHRSMPHSSQKRASRWAQLVHTCRGLFLSIGQPQKEHRRAISAPQLAGCNILLECGL